MEDDPAIAAAAFCELNAHFCVSPLFDLQREIESKMVGAAVRPTPILKPGVIPCVPCLNGLKEQDSPATTALAYDSPLTVPSDISSGVRKLLCSGYLV